MRRILVAIDGSPDARKALNFASDLADKFEAELLVLHVAPDSALSPHELALLQGEYAGELIRHAEQARLGHPAVAGESWAVQMAAREGETVALGRRLLGDRLLADAERVARDRGGTQVRAILASGNPAQEILAAANREGVDAIAMGSRGLGELSALLLGSVSHKISNHAQCTVIVVR